MELKAFKRNAERKCEASKLRREGSIPAVLYKRGSESESIAVEGTSFISHLRKVQSGRLPTTVFTLTTEDGRKQKALIKEIQYKPTNYDVMHLDFEALPEDGYINVKVPIEMTGVVDCVGVKLGGVLRQVIRHVRVRCPATNIPVSFKLDVANLDLRQVLRLKDIGIPETVRPLVNMNEVVVVIAKR